MIIIRTPKRFLDPELVVLSELPSTFIYDRKSLPHGPGIYMICDRGRVLYVGKSVCLAHRWRNHHLIPIFSGRRSAKIVWINVEESKLKSLEYNFILCFNPKYNGGVEKRIFNEISKNRISVTKRLRAYHKKISSKYREAHAVIARGVHCPVGRISKYVFDGKCVSPHLVYDLDRYLKKMGA